MNNYEKIPFYRYSLDRFFPGYFYEVCLRGKTNPVKPKIGKVIEIFLAAFLLTGLMTSCSSTAKQDTSQAENPIYGQYIDTMRQLKKDGDEYAENGMMLQAEYFYSIAGCGGEKLPVFPVLRNSR